MFYSATLILMLYYCVQFHTVVSYASFLLISWYTMLWYSFLFLLTFVLRYNIIRYSIESFSAGMLRSSENLQTSLKAIQRGKRILTSVSSHSVKQCRADSEHTHNTYSWLCICGPHYSSLLVAQSGNSQASVWVWTQVICRLYIAAQTQLQMREPGLFVGVFDASAICFFGSFCFLPFFMIQPVQSLILSTTLCSS